ncbi:double-stranded RNA-binding protein 1 [Cajanus cajan]|uniref:double-stranded RNA-binding protein 1 n=1 Tax=Cajanus cajan TaxID=3821 RepID=UPI00098D9656|nr:double-stranded RNA-binding protein 1 [Cajanus cajan]
MYKTKVQELCQRRSWPLPTYTNTREGPDHNPRFTSTVTVNGVSFHTPSATRNAKQAQNDAAMLAFLHFSPPSPSPSPLPSPSPSSLPLPSPSPSSLPLPSPSLPFHQDTLCFSSLSSFPQPSLCASSSGPSDAGSAVDDVLPTSGVLQRKLEPACQTSQISGAVTVTPVRDTLTVDDKKNVLHLYKNQLQSYLQKRNLGLPVYSSEWEGPPHAMRFKCKVTVGGQTYESDKFYSTLKDAEHAAAEVALKSLSPGGVEEGHAGLYKNLLQELAQKEGFRLPIYTTNRSGEAHMPIFESQVEVEGELYTGQEAKSKKQAELSAAKVAYMALKERKGKSDQRSLFPLSVHQGETHDPKSPVSPGFVNQNQPNKDKEANIITGLQHQTNPKSPVSPGLVNQPSKDEVKNAPFSSGSTCTENSSLSNDKSSPSLSGSVKVVSDLSEVSTSSFTKRVVVYSRKTNVEIKDGGTVLPFSDDKWVAYSYSQ